MLIRIKEIQKIAEEGRLVVNQSVSFGQTEAGCHYGVSKSIRVERIDNPTEWSDAWPIIDVEGRSWCGICPTGTIDGEPAVYFDPKTGHVFWGSIVALTVLPSADSQIPEASVTLDGKNLAYQKSILV